MAPEDIRAVNKEGYLEITWEEGHVGLYPYLKLRGDCPCAECVDERTGERRLDRSKLPEDLTIRNIRLVGNYAMNITWSDGHDTGIYTYRYLRSVCPCGKCRGGTG